MASRRARDFFFLKIGEKRDKFWRITRQHGFLRTIPTVWRKIPQWFWAWDCLRARSAEYWIERPLKRRRCCCFQPRTKSADSTGSLLNNKKLPIVARIR